MGVSRPASIDDEEEPGARAPPPRPGDLAEKPRVVALARRVKALLRERGAIPAMRKALTESGELLREPNDDLRHALRRLVFAKFSRTNISSYQSNDFECFDYELFELADDLPAFRGPRPTMRHIDRGEYFCVLGAAQTFGRLVAHPYGSLMSRALGLPVLNLSRAGVGPDLFLDERLLKLIRGARFVILQVMSGRSAGCPDYPGGRRVVSESGKKLSRGDVLEQIWNEDRKLAIHYVRRWNVNYLDAYKKLRQQIDRPTLLLWFSERAPWAWWPGMLKDKLSWGAFPQLVGMELYGQLCEIFADHHEAVSGQMREALVSRVTGEPCPYFGDSGTNLHYENSYYPISTSHASVAEALLPWARTALGSA